jgi:hypothetical protein
MPAITAACIAAPRAPVCLLCETSILRAVTSAIFCITKGRLLSDPTYGNKSFDIHLIVIHKVKDNLGSESNGLNQSIENLLPDLKQS